jgi:pimeloyl-ACP methyl ester carboxylesterase
MNIPNNQPKTTLQNEKRPRGGCTYKLLGLFVALCGVLLISGLLYQAVGAARDARRYPPPGQLVDIGDYRLHLSCVGEGSPTVILETMAGGTLVNWAWIQPEVAQETRVCAYERAGRGWSEAGIPAQDLWNMADDLHTLLQNAGITDPIVLVAHSIGGLYARAFTQQYPEQVAGMVLLDASHPDQFVRYPEEYLAPNESFLRVSAVFPALAQLGVFRLFFAMGGEIDFQDLPPQQHDELAAFWSSAAYWRNQRSEGLLAPTIYTQARELPSLGDLPLVVISAGEQPASWASLQEDLTRLSTNSRHLIVDDATHVSLAFHPDHARRVSAEILQMVTAVRGSR